ncbi:MAG: phenylalanine--tRNA ligase subunit beta, partial [Candidatus Enteromonas sp.]
MKVSFKYLAKHVDLSGITPEELAAKLTFAGAEVEEVSPFAQGTNLVIGHVLSCNPHPDSDHLHVLQVDEGSEFGVHQIVCGAPNAREGLKVIVARNGAKLPGGEIKPSRIRGVESDGMCCSLLELGVDKKYLSEAQCGGIEELPSDAPVGCVDVLGYLGLDDIALDLSILPDRPDLYSFENACREVSCLLEKPFIGDDMKSQSLTTTSFVVGSQTDKCPIFTARVIRGVQTRESPLWMKRMLETCGIRSINNIVDIGNYIMLLTGQPLNMYDLDKLPVPELVVRDDLNEDFLAMDGNRYALERGDLVVTSGGKPMCLAGIMTADACRVDENTKNIVVEAAYFDGASIRHTSNRIGLSSDSSLRFCKGINPDQMEYVQAKTSESLAAFAGTNSISETVRYDVFPHADRVIETSFSYINGRLGTEFQPEEILGALKRDYLIAEVSGDKLSVRVPSYRIDMDGQADITEEVIRILGLDHIKSELPSTRLSVAGLTEKQRKKNDVRRMLRGLGLNEVLTYTLVPEASTLSFRYLSNAKPYRLKNPLTVDRAFVRASLLPSVLESAAFNVARQNKDFG